MIYQYYFKRLELFKIPYRILLAYHSPLGNTIKIWRSYRMLTSILFIRNDMHILNLTYTIIQLRKAINALFHRIQTRGSFLIYAEEYNALKMKHDSVFIFVNSWLPGLLTNYRRVVINVAVNTFHKSTVKPLLSRGQLEAAQSTKFTPFPTARVIYDKTLFPRIPKIPSISFSISDNFIWLNECHNLGIPSIQICDTQSTFDLIAYPIVANQKSVPITYLLIHLFSEISNNALMQNHLAFSSYYKYHAQTKIWRSRLSPRRFRRITNLRRLRSGILNNITNRENLIHAASIRNKLGKRIYIDLAKKYRARYFRRIQPRQRKLKRLQNKNKNIIISKRTFHFNNHLFAYEVRDIVTNKKLQRKDKHLSSINYNKSIRNILWSAFKSVQKLHKVITKKVRIIKRCRRTLKKLKRRHRRLYFRNKVSFRNHKRYNRKTKKQIFKFYRTFKRMYKRMIFAFLGRRKVIARKKTVKTYILTNVPVYKQDFKEQFCFALAFRPEDLKHLLLMTQRLRNFN